MVFSSLVYIYIFMAVFFLSYYVAKKRKTRNAILLVFSLLFYAWGEPVYVFLMISSIVINYFIALIMKKEKEIIESEDGKFRYADVKFARRTLKNWLIFGVFFNLFLLGIFKYADFFINNINTWFNLDIKLLNIPLPIGISFFTFQILSYIIDVYYGKVNVQNNIIYLGAYVSAFPQLIAGPIVRYETIENELDNRVENRKNIADGIRRFIVGMSKKVLIANTMAQVIEIINSYSNIQYKSIGAIIIALCYTLQIYFDFSGYSDMAIGLGKMMGFKYDENFNYPYIAKTITDFWRRWHISLSTFFRDYLYIPLGGNRVSKVRHIFNILIVWFLTGMWHGASWNFIIWGLYFGVILIIEKRIPKVIKEHMPSVFSHVITLVIIVFSWVIFKYENMDEFMTFFNTLIGNYGIGNYDFFVNIGLMQFNYIAAFIAGIIFSTPVMKMIYDKLKENPWFIMIYDIGLICIFILSIICILVCSYNPFIYFKF